jgi:hypothetical protein
LGGGAAFIDLLCDLCPVLGQPKLLLVKHRNRVLNVFVDGLIYPALDVLPNKRLKFGTKSDFHLPILPL